MLVMWLVIYAMICFVCLLSMEHNMIRPLFPPFLWHESRLAAKHAQTGSEYNILSCRKILGETNFLPNISLFRYFNFQRFMRPLSPTDYTFMAGYWSNNCTRIITPVLTNQLISEMFGVKSVWHRYERFEKHTKTTIYSGHVLCFNVQM